MRNLTRVQWLIAAGSLLFALPLHAEANRDYLDPASFTQAPLEMVVRLDQKELLSGRDPGVSYQVGGGLVGYAVVGGLQTILSKGAENALETSREIFPRSEAEQVLMSSIRKSIEPISWVSLVSANAFQIEEQTERSVLLQQVSGPRLLDADCSYNISIRFHAVYAYCRLQVISTEGEMDLEDRWRDKNLIYSTYVEAQVEIANIAKSVGGRREQWISNSGAPLREGLRHALENVGALVGRRLLMQQTDYINAMGNEKIRLETVYVGMTSTHKGYLIEGQNNILQEFYPNLGGLSYLYKPGSAGMTIMEGAGGLFYHWTINIPKEGTNDPALTSTPRPPTPEPAR